MQLLQEIHQNRDKPLPERGHWEEISAGKSNVSADRSVYEVKDL